MDENGSPVLRVPLADLEVMRRTGIALLVYGNAVYGIATPLPRPIQFERKATAETIRQLYTEWADGQADR